LLRIAHEDYIKNGLTKKELTTNKVFVKIEVKLANWAQVLFDYIKPRLINASNPKTKGVLGPAMVAVSEVLHETLRPPNSHILFLPGCSQCDITEWVTGAIRRFGVRNTFGNDYKKYDSTQSEGSLGTANVIYRRMGVAGNALRILESNCEKQRMITREGGSVVRPCCLRTGSSDTTDTNTIVNICAHEYAFRKAGGKPGVDYTYAVAGDDLLAFVSDRLLARVTDIEQTLKNLGFLPKIKAGIHVAQQRVCSQSILPAIDPHTGETVYVPAPTIGKCMLKIPFTVANLPTGKRAADGQLQHRRGVALGLLPSCNHVPLLADYLRSELHHTRSARGAIVNRTKEATQRFKFAGGSYLPHPDAPSWQAKSYDLPLDQLDNLRHVIASMLDNGAVGWYGSASSDAVVQRLLEVDCA